MKISNIRALLEDRENRTLIIVTVVGIGAGFLCSAFNQWRADDFPWPNDLFYGLRTGTAVLIAFTLETRKFSKKWLSYFLNSPSKMHTTFEAGVSYQSSS